MSSDRMRRAVVILTLVTTILAAVIAGLEVEASTNADVANRESQRLAIIASGQQVTNTVAAEYQSTLVTDVLAATQESLAFGFAAAQRSSAGDTSGAREIGAWAEVAQARAERATALSDLYTDPRFAPQAPGGLPRLQDYFTTQNDQVAATVRQQNAAADDYNLWDGRSDSYVAILSVLAVTFFLLGVAQVSRRMRPLLAGVAGALMLTGIAWAASVTMG